jgi:hypothetical protein
MRITIALATPSLKGSIRCKHILRNTRLDPNENVRGAYIDPMLTDKVVQFYLPTAHTASISVGRLNGFYPVCPPKAILPYSLEGNYGFQAISLDGLSSLKGKD